MQSAHRLILATTFLCVASAVAVGQTRPAAMMTHPKQDQVIRLAETQFGFLSSRRVVLGDRGASDIKAATVVSTSDPINQRVRGVVFNYAMQAYGLVSGEIAFEVVPGFNARSLNWAGTPTPTVLVAPSIYVVNAPTGSEFVRVISMLKSSKSVRWVEASVDYIPIAIE